jgi:hypothetical protein
VKSFRGFLVWLKNGSDLKFRHLSHDIIGGNGGGGLVSNGRSFLLGNLLPTFSEAFSEKVSLKYSLFADRKRLEFPASFV